MLASRRRSTRRLLLVGLALVAVVVLAHLSGFTWNAQTGSVPRPDAATSPEDVVRSYVEAYDDRDFATMAAIYPSGQSAFSRYRPMGTLRNLRIVEGRVATEADLSGTSPEPGYSYYRVQVVLDYDGLAGSGSDLAYDDGPNGWAYRLERASPSQPWTITDHGNG